MNMRIAYGLTIAAALFAAGCGSDKSTSPQGANNPDPGPVDTKKVGFEFSTGKFEIQPGDTFECFYTATVTDRQLNVSSATAKQGPGGHHITVYYTDQNVPVGHHPCTDVEMVGLHQIAGASSGGEPAVALPDGYATKVPQGKQLVVQTHYIRTEKTPLTVEDSVTLKVAEDSEIKQFANSFVINDGSFTLPARANQTSTTECVVPHDFDVLLLLGHMHEWGAHYKLERLDAAGKVAETLYQTDWDPLYASHPPVNNYDPLKPLKLPKGTRLRQTCDWKNTEDHEMAFPREMCIMFTYYVPDNGFIICEPEQVKK